MRRSLRRYSPWLLAPLVALVAVLLFDGGSARRTARGFDEASFARDGAVGRTVRSFVPGQPEPEEPLYASNREGLPVEIELDGETWSRMLYPPNRPLYKSRATNTMIRFGNRPARPATLRLRGGGSLNMPGKPSFNAKLLHGEEFTRDVKLKHLFLMNARFDPHETNTRFAYSLLSDLGLFHLHVQFVRARVNGTPLGTFLLIEPPQHGIRRTNEQGCTAIYRRFGLNKFERLWASRVPQQHELIGRLIDLGLRDNDDGAIASDYDQILDVDQFLTWLAVNSVLLNTDTTDELFLYETRGGDLSAPGRLHLMAWDYDDTLRPAGKLRDGTFDDPLLFACRDAHERHVQTDPILRARFRARLAELLAGELAPDRLVKRLEAARALRDGLDEGDPAPEVAAAREARAKHTAAVEQVIRTQHAQLTTALAAESAAALAAEAYRAQSN